MPADWDCRGLLDELVSMGGELDRDFKAPGSDLEPVACQGSQPQNACA
jgi:hypothetical protein